MIRHRFVIGLFALFCAAHSAVIPEVSAQRSRANIQTVVDDAVRKEMQKQKIVGVSVGVIIKSRLVYAQGYGFADVEAQVPATNKTIFNWASNSKPVLAILAMQLVQNGKLDLDKTIDNYLPDLPDHLHSITPRHLLCHQSGIPHYSNGTIVSEKPAAKPEDEHDPVVAMKRFIESPLIFKPGEKKDYSSYAYLLLSAVVQAAGEEPIADQIFNRVSGPLKMSSFQMDVPFENQSDWTKAYKVTKGRPVEIKDYSHAWKHGAGAYKSNVTDFSKFAIALMQAKLINRRTSIQMMTPQATNDGEMTTLGLGVYVAGEGASLKVSHNGSQDETKTRMVIFPNRRHGLVVMCNCRHAEPGDITTAIYNALSKNKIRYQ